jgi:hypothetical protein
MALLIPFLSLGIEISLKTNQINNSEITVTQNPTSATERVYKPPLLLLSLPNKTIESKSILRYGCSLCVGISKTKKMSL